MRTENIFHDIPNSVSWESVFPWGLLSFIVAVVGGTIIHFSGVLLYRRQERIRDERRGARTRDSASDLISGYWIEPASTLRYAITTLAVALFIGFFMIFGASGVQRSFWMGDTSDALQAWVDKEYGIELTSREASLLRWNPEVTVAAEYEGNPVDLSLERVGSKYDNASTWVLLYRDGAEPLVPIDPK